MSIVAVTLLLIPLFLVIPILLGVYTYRDAKRRGMNAPLWALVAALAPTFLGFLIYLLVRGSYSDWKCPRCGGAVEETYVSESVVNYIVDLICATRNHSKILRGASPRATLAVTAMAKAVARLRGRDYVVPGDVREVFVHTIAHRLLLTPLAQAQNESPEEILRQILETVPAPKLR